MLVGSVGLDCQHGIDFVRAERAGDMCVHGFILVGALCLQLAFFIDSMPYCLVCVEDVGNPGCRFVVVRWFLLHGCEDASSPFVVFVKRHEACDMEQHASAF